MYQYNFEKRYNKRETLSKGEIMMQIITQTLTTPLTKTAKLTGYVLDNTAEIDENRVRPAVVICPGGGYAFVSQREGQAIANQMNAIGLQAFVLDYSCTPTHFPAQLAELATAVKVIREHANEWHVDPNKIIAMGFSAGGHLAGSLATMWNQPVLKDLGFDPEEIRPNALAIGYPVITSGEKAHRGSFDHLLGENPSAELLEQVSLEKQVSADTPQTFMWQTYEDQAVPVDNTIMFAQALRDHGVNCEYHMFPHGPHGLALASAETAANEDQIVPAVQQWAGLFKTWVTTNVMD